MSYKHIHNFLVSLKVSAMWLGTDEVLKNPYRWTNRLPIWTLALQSESIYTSEHLFPVLFSLLLTNALLCLSNSLAVKM